MSCKIQLSTPKLGIRGNGVRYRFYIHMEYLLDDYRRLQRELFPEEFI